MVWTELCTVNYKQKFSLFGKFHRNLADTLEIWNSKSGQANAPMTETITFSLILTSQKYELKNGLLQDLKLFNGSYFWLMALLYYVNWNLELRSKAKLMRQFNSIQFNSSLFCLFYMHIYTRRTSCRHVNNSSYKLQ